MQQFIPAQLVEIAEKVDRQERLSFEDGLQLFECDDFMAVGALAKQVRERINGNLTYYNINRHMNYTNVCVSDCAFCGFYRRVKDPEAYEWSVSECIEIARKAYREGARELHIVGGLHPRLQFDYYTSLLSELPDVMSSNDTSITSRSASRPSATLRTRSMSKPVGLPPSSYSNGA